MRKLSRELDTTPNVSHLKLQLRYSRFKILSQKGFLFPRPLPPGGCCIHMAMWLSQSPCPVCGDLRIPGERYMPPQCAFRRSWGVRATGLQAGTAPLPPKNGCQPSFSRCPQSKPRLQGPFCVPEDRRMPGESDQLLPWGARGHWSRPGSTPSSPSSSLKAWPEKERQRDGERMESRAVQAARLGEQDRKGRRRLALLGGPVP